MPKFYGGLESFFASEIFTKFLSKNTLKIAEITTLLQILIKKEIPFDIVYSPGTRRKSPLIEFTIYINPTTKIDFLISLDSSPSTF